MGDRAAGVDPARVQAAVAEWVWLPDGSRESRTDEYHVIDYPDELMGVPTQVQWSRSGRPVGELIDEVADRARAWGRPALDWWVSEATLPADTERALVARGGQPKETVAVLAYDLGGGVPDLAVPTDLRVAFVVDEPTVRDAGAVSARVWSDRAPTEAEIQRELRGLADPASAKVVAYLDGRPASYGGCTIAGDAARLWGAATLAEYRGRGAYRAVLAERLQWAAAHGAAFAIVKGRVETSGPILRRAGFVAYGEERSYTLTV